MVYKLSFIADKLNEHKFVVFVYKRYNIEKNRGLSDLTQILVIDCRL